MAAMTSKFHWQNLLYAPSSIIQISGFHESHKFSRTGIFFLISRTFQRFESRLAACINVTCFSLGYISPCNNKDCFVTA